jgi:hypothetical protein
MIGKKIGPALARASAAGHDVACTTARFIDCLDLMLVQVKGMAFRRAEDVCGCYVQDVLRYQFVYRGWPSIGGTDLQQKIRPQPRLFDQRLLDELPHPFISHDKERADESQ